MYDLMALLLQYHYYHRCQCFSKGEFLLTQEKACSRETHSSSQASKTYGHNAFHIIHIHTTVINSGRAHTIQHCTHCGLWLRLQSWLMPQSPHRPPSPKWPQMCRVWR